MLRRSRLVRRRISEARFSKGIYNQIARYIKSLKTGEISVEKFADLIASMFEEDNPLFDRRKFLQACGIDGGIKESRVTEDNTLANQIFNQIKYGGLTTIKTPEDVQGKVLNPLGTMKQPDKSKKVTERPGTGYPNIYGYFMGESKKGRK